MHVYSSGKLKALLLDAELLQVQAGICPAPNLFS